ncbi:MAG: hypothetical protein V3S06_03940, partial [candidate division Zixibacteria bacterium]
MSFVKTDLNSSAHSTLEKSARPEYVNWPNVNLRPNYNPGPTLSTIFELFEISSLKHGRSFLFPTERLWEAALP